MGSGENEMSKGRAVESERRWNNCLTAMGVLGKSSQCVQEQEIKKLWQNL